MLDKIDKNIFGEVNTDYQSILDKTFVKYFSAKFCISRMSTIIRPGSKLERYLAKLRGNKNFY